MRKCTIFSAFVVESLPKCVYVEAHKEYDVREVCPSETSIFSEPI
jgi:hypothetical protein